MSAAVYKITYLKPNRMQHPNTSLGNPIQPPPPLTSSTPAAVGVDGVGCLEEKQVQ
jgi:hypothetical protein